MRYNRQEITGRRRLLQPCSCYQVQPEKTLFIPELGKKVTVRVSAKGLKTMKKRGAFQTLKKAGMI
ncbi:MAG: hypothetical protein Athens041674_691 [Parcubacteria group bacterium Athens0416_74]|nr:MAG: hypothetical protein Athens041674_691 [Parcubacteria group bacterium Athens0416_74]